MARRKRKLEAYLAALLAHPVYGESHELRAFLQALPDGDSAAVIAAGGSSSSTSTSSSGGGGGAANPGRLGSAATVLPRRLGEGREWTPLREGAAAGGAGGADGGGAAAGAAAALAEGMGVEDLQSGRLSQVPTTPWVSADDPRAMDDVSLQRIQSRAYAILKEVCC